MASYLDFDPRLMLDYLEILKPRLRIAVIYGGDRKEYGSVIFPTINFRPWKSYKSVAEDIKTALHNVGFEHVSLIADDMNMAKNLKEDGIQIAWLNTGGTQGFNPVAHAPALLEMLGIPYVGHNSMNASILDNKHLFKYQLQALGLPTAMFSVWMPSHGAFSPFSPRFRAVFNGYEGPFVVKPVSGRASVYVNYSENPTDLPEAVADVYDHTQNAVIIEKYLPGREFCISVCGPVVYRGGSITRCHTPFTFSGLERRLDVDEHIFTSMDQRAITVDRVRLLNHPDDQATCANLHHLGQQIYLALNIRSLVRIDVRTDERGHLFVLEANPKPDLARPKDSVTSLATSGLAEQGMTYEDLILSMLVERLDYLMSFHPHMVKHLMNILNLRTQPVIAKRVTY